MSEVVIKVEKLSKIYRLGQVGTGTLSHDLNKWWYKILGKDDPYSKISQINDRTKQNNSNYVYALKDVSFQLNKGDVLGIIGKNGAGKSTLLKLISRITSPTYGSIKAKGKIASLLEIGTGMHQEMTARENIFLNGSILGMTKSEISSKFDEIIDFSGCKMYVDTPVKRFSSGMRVRLGFAVAAFLNPDILIVDEVLAVGDAEFQKKAISKIKNINSNEGRTILFVSHNLASVKTICNKGLVINNGQLDFMGNSNDAIDRYVNLSFKKSNFDLSNLSYNKFIKINDLKIISDSLIDLRTSFIIHNDFNVLTEDIELIIRYDLYNIQNIHVFRQEISIYNSSITEKGNYRSELIIPSKFLNKGNYFINIDFIDFEKKSLLNIQNALYFEIHSHLSDENISKRDVNNSILNPSLENSIDFKK
jgi:lipopolysaccharide transport system ATP-binding protein